MGLEVSIATATAIVEKGVIENVNTQMKVCGCVMIQLDSQKHEGAGYGLRDII